MHRRKLHDGAILLTSMAFDFLQQRFGAPLLILVVLYSIRNVRRLRKGMVVV